MSPLDAIYEQAMRARALERLLLELYAQNHLFGTVHTCIGQELCATALHPHLRPGVDAFFGTHRCHGHYVAYGAPIDGFLAELMGREGAVCQGRGGSQHLHWKRFFSSGIQGGTALLATGFAWGLAQRGEPGIAVAQMGDGTLGEGAVYEALTFASLLRAPVLFLLEWNGWAQSTDVTRTTPGDIPQRIAGFGVQVMQADDRAPEELHARMQEAVATVRRGQPLALIVKTRRLMAHSKGDDDRAKELVDALWAEDPLAKQIAAHGLQARYDAIAAELRKV
ncbi:MAG TPA: thiamine pyrophosphate-dependent dehydrogenase E1 component subunit alpha, partial [Polyangiales bacterium]|nr:thiamine pyrophosphate-dependent dehydrogenase E1 component subunit alpha [Polyangiales bacterium]